MLFFFLLQVNFNKVFTGKLDKSPNFPQTLYNLPLTFSFPEVNIPHCPVSVGSMPCSGWLSGTRFLTGVPSPQEQGLDIFHSNQFLLSSYHGIFFFCSLLFKWFSFPELYLCFSSLIQYFVLACEFSNHLKHLLK